MDAVTRIERTLAASLDRVDSSGGPPLLAAAMRHAVFPRGARIRSRLCLAVAAACGEDDPAAADGAAAAIEFMHCASLVHDDLPCFDNADTAPRPPIGASRLRRAAGGAGGRCADCAVVPDDCLGRGAMARPPAR